MTTRRQQLQEKLARLISGMDEGELQHIISRFEQEDVDEDDEDDDEDEDDEELDDDDDDIEPSRPIRNRWPGNIRLRKPVPVPVTQTADHGPVGLGDIGKLHAIGARVGYDSKDPNMQAVYAAVIARRKAFADLGEELGKMPSTLRRSEICALIERLDDAPWEGPLDAAPGGLETIAKLASEWKCACGWTNSDLRRRCRNCGGPR